jgi:hypothetical protein
VIAKQPRPDELPETTPPYRRRAARDFSKRATIGVIDNPDAKPRTQPFGFSRALVERDGWDEYLEALT